MGDNSDDDDIVVLKEVIVDSSINQKWRYKVPNPKLQVGSAERLLQSVRDKLNMLNPDIEDDKADSCVKSSSDLGDISGEMEVPTTPQKSSMPDPPIALTPEQIEELTQNCLDSDNEPDVTPIKFTHQSQEPQNVPKSTPKRALSFGVKASTSLRNRASRFFGTGTSSEDVEKILSQEPAIQNGSPFKSPTKSPSPKKKRLSKNSPIRLLPSHRKLGKSPGRRSPGRSPGTSPGKSPIRKIQGRDLDFSSVPPHSETEVLPDGPYYFEAFCHIVKKVCHHPGYQHLFLEMELRNLRDVDSSKKEFALYVRLMNRKDKWNRTKDISYKDISDDLSPFIDSLENQGLLSCDLSDEKLEVLLTILKVEELKTLGGQFKIKKTASKSDLVQSLISMQRTQPTLFGISPLRKSVVKLLGRCVRLTPDWRIVFRRCILLFSMFHSSEDLDKLSGEQALLLLQVKLGNMVYPLSNISIQPSAQIFVTRDQLIRYEETKEIKQDLNIAIENKNFQLAEELTKKCMKQFSTLLELKSETEHVLQLPQCLQKFCAGSIYAYTLTKSVDILKQGRNYNLALDVLKLLTGQKIYFQHYQATWALMMSNLFHINLKDVVKACKLLCSILKDRSSLRPVDRTNLQLRAERLIKLKKNGLSQELKDELASVMDPTPKPPETVEICARAYVGTKRGLKKVYIRDTEEGKEFMSVEETVLAHYKSLGFANGVHDEGSTIISLCLLFLWDIIYDTSVPLVFQSPYQDRPLDWGSKTFYDSRKEALEARFSSLLLKDAKVVAEELSECLSLHLNTTSLVNWKRLEGLDIHVFLVCVTVPVFAAVSRRLVEDWKSNRNGFPDLIVWSPLQKKCLFVEVKSPNDTLSTVQGLWLSFLKKCNATAIVANIRESGSKNSSA